MSASAPAVHLLPVPGRWCVHAYYTLCPWAPDGSGRLLLAAAERVAGMGEVLILDADGRVAERFGRAPVQGGFWHTGRWQSWSPDAGAVLFQGGDQAHPQVVRHACGGGGESSEAGDMEGAPPHGGPIVSGLMGMLYAAGYGDGRRHPEQAPVPFAARDRHGLFRAGGAVPALSVAAVLERHPQRDRLLAEDAAQRARTGDGLTLMCYCVRWSPDGRRLLFYFGNHCTDARRGEPRIAYVLTAGADLGSFRVALDLSFGRAGVHWHWQPDGERLIGYGPSPEDPARLCLAEVRHDGSGYRLLSRHASGGHPTACPSEPHLVATDEGGAGGGVLLIDTRTDTTVWELALPRRHGTPPPGRNPQHVCHHPVWDRDGRRLLVNLLPGPDAQVAVLER